jgi:hypothetical protein
MNKPVVLRAIPISLLTACMIAIVKACAVGLSTAAPKACPAYSYGFTGYSNCSGGEIERLRVKVLSESSASLNNQQSSVHRSRKTLNKIAQQPHFTGTFRP